MRLITNFFQVVPVWTWVISSALLVVVGDYFAKRWSIERGPALFWLAAGSYFFCSQLYLPSLLKSGLVITSLVWSLISTIGLLAIGLFVFHEHLSNTQIIGVTLGVVAMLLLAWE